MKNFLATRLSFFRSHFEFTTSLSLTTCENRLEDIGASIREVGPTGKRRSTTFILEHPQHSSLWQPSLVGKLQEIENGTLVRADFYPTRLFSNYIAFIILLFIFFYIKNYFFLLLPIILSLINITLIDSHRSSWQYLEDKVTKSLKHWKKE